MFTNSCFTFNPAAHTSNVRAAGNNVNLFLLLLLFQLSLFTHPCMPYTADAIHFYISNFFIQLLNSETFTNPKPGKFKG